MKVSEQKPLMMNSGFKGARKKYSDVHSGLEENITVERKGWFRGNQVAETTLS